MKKTGHAGIDEPFAGLFTQGMVVHETYAKANGEWVTPAEVKIEGAEGGARTATLATTGEPIEIGGIEKMSKSKKNTIDPDDIMGTYGADMARWFMLSDSPPERDVEWTERGVQGAWRFTNRLWRLVSEAAELAKNAPADRPAEFGPAGAGGPQGRPRRARQGHRGDREAAFQRRRRPHLRVRQRAGLGHRQARSRPPISPGRCARRPASWSGCSTR